MIIGYMLYYFKSCVPSLLKEDNQRLCQILFQIFSVAWSWLDDQELYPLLGEVSWSKALWQHWLLWHCSWVWQPVLSPDNGRIVKATCKKDLCFNDKILRYCHSLAVSSYFAILKWGFCHNKIKWPSSAYSGKIYKQILTYYGTNFLIFLVILLQIFIDYLN